jgi:hypothetical protein
MLYNRTSQVFSVIQLPKTSVVEDFGVAECCVPELVLANGSENWQNQVTSAFIKLQLVTDTVNFVLKKDDVNATYQPTNVQCTNDSLGYYCTVDWTDVINSDGIGCYSIEINYNIDGNVGVIEWGKYNVQEYSVEKAVGTVMIKAIYNQYHSRENIDFTDSNVVDTIRVNGMFGKRDPKTVIDNLIYQNNKLENVIRENVNNFIFESDAIQEKYSTKLIDLYFLSETDLYLTDHNFHNHNQALKDFNVIVSESPTFEYLEGSKFAKIKCIFVEKIRNSFSKYNG